jgi:CYTH domain-containing protein
MKAVRRFLVAPSLSRLARRERGSTRLTEGYFATQSGRNSHVLIEGSQCQLVLVVPGANGVIGEERTDVPRAHADALLDVCAGRAVIDRTRLTLAGGREVFLERVSVPGPFDLISVEFDSQSDAQGFAPPAWFGPEVTSEEGYDRRSIALNGVPSAGERVTLTDAALDSLLDALEGGRYTLPRTSGEPGVLDSFRRFAPPAEAASAEPAPEMTAPAAELPATAAEPVTAEAPNSFPAWSAEGEAAAAEPAKREDSRIDDVIAGLSQVLGAPTEPRESSETRRPAAVVEVDRWVGRRRSEG